MIIKNNDARGFSLLEVVLLLLVISLLAGSLAPLSLKLIAARKAEATRREMERILRAITGDPDQGYWGFIGDLGRMPVALSELVEAGPYPLYHTDTTYRVGMGWNGPYFNGTKEDVTNDAFGRPYAFGPETGGQIRSAGADGQFGTGDDIVLPQKGMKASGVVRIELPEKGDFLVRLYYSDGGIEKYMESAEAPFVFQDVHRGPHAVEVLRRGEKGWELLTRTMVILSGPQGIFMVRF